jgi:hypothetical protein
MLGEDLLERLSSTKDAAEETNENVDAFMNKASRRSK